MRPVLPSWTRSSIGMAERPYLRAIDTTSRRLAWMNSCMARSPSSASHSSSSRVARLGAPPLARPIRPVSKRCCANKPASIDLLSSTSRSASKRGVRAISARYMPTLSLPSTLVFAPVVVAVAMSSPAFVLTCGSTREETRRFPSQPILRLSGAFRNRLHHTTAHGRLIAAIGLLLDRVRRLHAVQDPGELPGALVPGPITAAHPTVAGAHLGLEDDRFIAGAVLAQTGDPFGRFGIEYTRVVQAGDSRDSRIILRSDVLVR